MKLASRLPTWSIVAPIASWVIFALVLTGYRTNPWWVFEVLVVACLVAGILAAVFHAEVVAHRVGEPYGTLVLALAVTAIEVALIVSLMIAGGEKASGLASDAVFASIMIILNGMVGICLLSGGRRHGEQSFGLYGISAALATLAAISVLTLVLPNFTTTSPGPVYSNSQLTFIAVVSLVLYGTFVMIQTVKHRDYFLPVESAADEAVHAQLPSNKLAILSALLLLACLGSVVLLAKTLSPSLEAAVADMGAPKTLVGIIIAAVVLLPESIAAYQAARANRLQTSLNLALGSALASIGLTIPAVALVSLLNGWSLTLGIDSKSSVLLLLSLLVASLSLGTGRTTVMQGTVHLVIFAVYLFTAIVP